MNEEKIERVEKRRGVRWKGDREISWSENKI